MSALGKVRQSDFPRYDSTKNKPAWPDYARDVFSFLSGVDGGKPLAGCLKDFMGLHQEAAPDNPMAPTWMKPGEDQHSLFKGLDEAFPIGSIQMFSIYRHSRITRWRAALARW